MYGWIWRHLPGNRAVKALCALILLLAAVWVLFTYVFPAVAPMVPFNDVTVDGSTGPS